MDIKKEITEIITHTHKMPYGQAKEILQLIADNYHTLQLHKTQAEQLPQVADINSNIIASIFCKHDEKKSFLDSNNIVWKWLDNSWIGKRSVWTFDFRACWLEDTTIDNVKSFWCGGKEANYNEIFTHDL